MLRKLTVAASQRITPRLAVLIGVALSLPFITCGLFLDDYPQRIVMLSGDVSNIFTSYDFHSALTQHRIFDGVLPWWSDPDAKLTFFRPLSQWLRQFDYALWPNAIGLMHLQSVLWYGLVIAVAGVAFRALHRDTRFVALALLLFAIDYGHGGTVAWIANRNILVGLVFSLGALTLFTRRGLAAYVAGAVLFALSMACGEAALAITGYFLGYECFLSQRPWSRRLLRLAGMAAVALAWLGYWSANGYGTRGAYFYIDPLSEPARFLHAFPLRFFAYLSSNWFLPPAEIYGGLESGPYRLAALLFAVVCVAVIGWIVWRRVGRQPHVRALAIGMVVAVVPICGIIPVSRSTWYVGIGTFGIMATFLLDVFTAAQPAASTRPQRVLASTLTSIHLLLSPLLFVAVGLSLNPLDRLSDSVRLHLPDQGSTKTPVLVLAASNYFGSITLPLQRDQALSMGTAPTRRPPSISHIVALTAGNESFQLSRPAADVLEVSNPAGLHLRDPDVAFRHGSHFDPQGVAIDITAYSADGHPSRIVYHFDPGTLASYRVLAWNGKRFVDATLPAPGQTREIPRP